MHLEPEQLILDETLLAALGVWQLEPIESIDLALSGTMNETFMVTTAERRVVLRRHRWTDRRPVELEHEVMAHVRSRGLPVPLAIATPGDALVVDHEGQLYSLFAHAQGSQLSKAQLTPAHARSMGEVLARIHLALDDFPYKIDSAPAEPPRQQESLQHVRSLLALIENRTELTEQDTWAQDHLRSKAVLLDSTGGPVLRTVPGDAHQMIHGDYQETNLFFAGSEVVDVIDWDKAEPRWPVDEVIRCLDLALLLEPAACGALLDGYRSVRDLPTSDLDLAAGNYGFHRLHDQWLFDSIYVRNDDRCRVFLESGPYVSFAERWKLARMSVA